MQIKKDDQCTEDWEYSLTDCIWNYVNQKVGCSLFTSKMSKICTTKEQLLELKDILIWVKEVPMNMLRRETGCLQRCSETLVIDYLPF